MRVAITCLLIGLSMASGRLWAEQSLRALVAEGNYQQAYELAKTQLETQSGEPGFDFLYGLSALETGHPQEAIFALERVIAVYPENHRARLELARAHYAVGNFEQARLLFDAVLASDPPPRVKENIQVFLDSLADRSQQRNRQTSISVDFKMGLDSNINSATQASNVTLPIGLILQLGDTSREISDEFAELALSGSYLQLLRKDMGVFAAASLSDHQNASISQFDLRVAGISAGYVYKAAGQTLRLPLQWQQLDVDRDMYRRSTGLGLEWGFERFRNQQIAAFGQWAQQRHVESEKTHDVDLTLFGGAWSIDLLPWRSKLSVSAYFADEKPTSYAQQHNGRQYTGVRLAGLWRPQPQHELQLSWTQQSVEHDVIHQVFGVVRSDDYSLFGLDWAWRFDPHWRLGLNLSATSNKSNIDIYTYDRTQQYLTLKYSY